MDTSVSRESLQINGRRWDLTHLKAISRRVCMDLPGGFQKVVQADFHFSCHCFSRSPIQRPDGSLEPIPASLLVPDGSTKVPRPRIFCPERYELSRQLVPCIDAMIASNGIVMRTRHVNYFHLKLLTHAVAGLPNPADYYVFFGIRIIKPVSRPRQFKISVESAYVGANARGRLARRFSEALGIEWAGQKK